MFDRFWRRKIENITMVNAAYLRRRPGYYCPCSIGEQVRAMTAAAVAAAAVEAAVQCLRFPRPTWQQWPVPIQRWP